MSVVERNEVVTIGVHDDGRGFAPGADHEGFGLIGMQERVTLMGGTLRMEAAPGAGTTLEAALPVRRRGPQSQLSVAN